MTIEKLVAVLTVLATISLAVERLIELAKSLYEKIQSESLRSAVKLLSAVVVGLSCSFLFSFDMLKELGVSGVSPIVGYVAAGLLSSTGSTTINRLLGWLKTLRDN